MRCLTPRLLARVAVRAGPGGDARFYGEVFGFEAFDRLAEEHFDEIVMLHPPTGMVLCLQQHHTNQGEPADPSRTGADHIAFRVASRAELDDWAERLAALGVAPLPGRRPRLRGRAVPARPDEFQLELFWRENHP